MTNRLILIAFLSLVGARTGFADDRLMQLTEQNGLVLSGAEYWPYHGAVEINYPADLLWGFYPERGVVPPGEEEPNVDSATPQAIACAEQAYTKLMAYFASPHPLFGRILQLGATQLVSNKFYLWTNDYTRADRPYPFGERRARLWYWKRNPQVEGRTPGYWKWESTVDQDGHCDVPNDSQIDTYLRQFLSQLEHP